MPQNTLHLPDVVGPASAITPRLEHFEDVGVKTEDALVALVRYMRVDGEDGGFKARLHRSGKHTEATSYSEAKRYVRALTEVHPDRDTGPDGGDDTVLYHADSKAMNDAAKRARERARIIAKARTGGTKVSKRAPKWLQVLADARMLAKKARKAKTDFARLESDENRPSTATTSFSVHSAASNGPPTLEMVELEAERLADRAAVAEGRARRLCEEEALSVVQGYCYAERGDVRRPVQVLGEGNKPGRRTRFAVAPAGSAKPQSRSAIRSGLKPASGAFPQTARVRVGDTGGVSDDDEAPQVPQIDTLGFVGFVRLLRDARLLNNRLTTVDAAALHRRMARRGDGIPTTGDGLRDALVAAGRRALGEPIGRHRPPAEEAVTDAARAAHAHAEDYRNLLEAYVLPFCSSAALPKPDLDLCYAPVVVAGLAEHRQRLRQVFAHYATLGSLGVGVDRESWDYCMAGNCTMNIDEAVQFALNFDIIPTLLTKGSFLELFREVERANDGDGLADCIAMPAFEELLVKLARKVAVAAAATAASTHGVTVTEMAGARQLIRCLPDEGARDRLLCAAPPRAPPPRTDGDIAKAGATRIAELEERRRTQLAAEEDAQREAAARRRGEARQRFLTRRDANAAHDHRQKVPVHAARKPAGPLPMLVHPTPVGPPPGALTPRAAPRRPRGASAPAPRPDGALLEELANVRNLKTPAASSMTRGRPRPPLAP